MAVVHFQNIQQMYFSVNRLLFELLVRSTKREHELFSCVNFNIFFSCVCVSVLCVYGEEIWEAASCYVVLSYSVKLPLCEILSLVNNKSKRVELKREKYIYRERTMRDRVFFYVVVSVLDRFGGLIIIMKMYAYLEL